MSSVCTTRLARIAMIREVAWNDTPLQYDEFIQHCAATTASQLSEDDLVSLSFHANPHVPWSNAAHSRVALDCLASVPSTDIAQWIRPYLLAVSRPNKRVARLAQLGVNQEILQEDSRRQWKAGAGVGSLGMIWPLVVRGEEYSIVIPFLLVLFDDYEQRIKLQACHILLEVLTNHRDLLMGGVVQELRQSVDVCLSYLPPLTPEAQAEQLLQVAWPCALLLASTPIQRIELVGQVLSLISHLKHEWKFMSFFVEQLKLIVDQLQAAVLVSLSRITFVLGQILINPFVIDDYADGFGLILTVLECQKQIISIVASQDDDAQAILHQYRFDFSAMWTTLRQRLAKIHTPYKQAVDAKLDELHATGLWVPAS